jgi:hypothetical protein
MPEWVVLYKAVADFSDLTRKAAEALAEMEALKKAAQNLNTAQLSSGTQVATMRDQQIKQLGQMNDAMRVASQGADLYNQRVNWAGATSEQAYLSNLDREVQYRRLLNIQEQRGFFSPYQNYAFRNQEIAQQYLYNRAVQQGYATPEQYLQYLSALRGAMNLENQAWNARVLALNAATQAAVGQANAVGSTHSSAQQLLGGTTNLESALNRLNKLQATPTVQLEDTQFGLDLASDQAALNTMDSFVANPTVVLMDDDFRAADTLDMLMLTKLSDMVARPKVEIDDSEMVTGIEAITSALRRLSATKSSVTESVTVQQTTLAPLTGGANSGASPPLYLDDAPFRAAITRDEAELHALNNLRADPQAKLDDAGLMASVDRDRAAIDTLNQAVRVTVIPNVQAPAATSVKQPFGFTTAANQAAYEAEAKAARDAAAAMDIASAAAARNAGDDNQASDSAEKTAAAMQDIVEPAQAAKAALEAAGAGADDSGNSAHRSWGYWGALTRQLTLFGGFFGSAEMIGKIAAWHVLMDGVIEVLALWIPALSTAAIGLAAWGAAGVQAGEQVGKQMYNTWVVSKALNEAIPPLKGSFQQLAQAVTPQVYELFGDALTVMGNKGSTLNKIIGETGSFLENMGAKIAVFLTGGSGNGLMDFFQTGAKDLALIGKGFESVGIIAANFIKATALTHVAEDLAMIGDKVLALVADISKMPTPLLASLLGLHAILLWGGLMTTMVTKVALGIDMLVGRFGPLNSIAFKTAQTLNATTDQLTKLAMASPAVKNVAAALGSTVDELGQFQVNVAKSGMSVEDLATQTEKGKSLFEEFGAGLDDAGKQAVALAIATGGSRTDLENLLTTMGKGGDETDTLSGRFSTLGKTVQDMASNLPIVGSRFGGLGKDAEEAGGALEDTGTKSEGLLKQIGGIATKLPIVGGGFSALMEIPVWGWVAAGALALAGVGFWLSTLPDQTQQWINATQKVVQTASLYQVVDKTVGALAATTTELGRAQAGLGGNTQELTGFQQQLTGQLSAELDHVGQVSKAYGVGYVGALALLNAAGVKTNQLFSTSNKVWADAFQQVTGLIKGYQAMGQQLGTVGGDLNVLTVSESTQVKEMGNLNTAWDTWIKTVTGSETALITMAQGFATFATDAKTAGASMTGLNAPSLQLQSDFQTNLTNVEQLFDAFRSQQALTGTGNFTKFVKDLVASLIPMAGGSKTAAAEISALAQEAGGPATTNIKELQKWVGNIKDPLTAAKDATDKETQAASNLSLEAQRLSSSLQSQLNPAMVTAAFNAYGGQRALSAFATALVKTGPNSEATINAGKAVATMFLAIDKNSGAAASQFIGWAESMGLSKSAAEKLWGEVDNGTKPLAGMKQGLHDAQQGGNDLNQVNLEQVRRQLSDTAVQVTNLGKPSTWDDIKTGAANVVTWFKTAWTPIGTFFVNAFKIAEPVILGIFKIIFDELIAIAKAAIDALEGHWGAAWDALKTGADQVWNVIYTTGQMLFKKLFDPLWQWFDSGFVQPVEKFFTGTFAGWLRTVGNQFATLWSTAWTGFNRDVSGNIEHFFVTLIPQWLGQISNAFSTTWSTVWTTFNRVISGNIEHFFIALVPSWLSDIGNGFSTTWSTVWNGFNRVVSANVEHFFITLVPQWLGDAANGFAALWSDAWNAFNRTVLANIEHFFITLVPQWLGDAANGFAALWSDAWNAFNRTVLANIEHFFITLIPGWFKDTTSGFASTWSTVWTDFNRDVISNLEHFFVTTVPGWLTTMGNGIKNTFSGAFKSAIDTAVGIINTPINFINNDILKHLPGGLKIPTIPKPFAAGGSTFSGSVPGAPSHDNHVAALMGGEYVLRQPARMAIERQMGPGFLNQLNHYDTLSGSGSRGTLASQKIPGFASGGATDCPPGQTCPSANPMPGVPEGNVGMHVADGGAIEQKMLDYFNSKVGHPYLAENPQRFGPKYYDCSGLMYEAAHAAGVPLPRGDALANLEANWFASDAGLQPYHYNARSQVETGDLLFFVGADPAPSNFGEGIGHVGMAASATTLVSAYDTAEGVTDTPIDQDKFVVGIRLGGIGGKSIVSEILGALGAIFSDIENLTVDGGTALAGGLKDLVGDVKGGAGALLKLAREGATDVFNGVWDATVQPMVNVLPDDTAPGALLRGAAAQIKQGIDNFMMGQDQKAQAAAAASGAGGSAPAGGATGGEMANGRELYNYLLTNLFGGHKIAAAGATASIWGESLWNPFVHDSAGRGIIEWTPPSSISNADYSGGMATQLPAIIRFVQNNGDEGVIRQMMSASSVAAAAALWDHGVERAGISDVHSEGIALASQIAGLAAGGAWGNGWESGGSVPTGGQLGSNVAGGAFAGSTPGRGMVTIPFAAGGMSVPMLGGSMASGGTPTSLMAAGGVPPTRTMSSRFASGGVANLITVAEYLMQHGATRTSAAGIAGDIYGESGGNPESVGDGGFGLIGWTGNTIGLPAGYKKPTGNVAHDLQVQEAGVVGYINANGGFGRINAQTSVNAAADIFSLDYERPAVRYSDTRPSIAAEVYAALPAAGASAGYTAITLAQAQKLLDAPVQQLPWWVAGPNDMHQVHTLSSKQQYYANAAELSWLNVAAKASDGYDPITVAQAQSLLAAKPQQLPWWVAGVNDMHQVHTVATSGQQYYANAAEEKWLLANAPAATTSSSGINTTPNPGAPPYVGTWLTQQTNSDFWQNAEASAYAALLATNTGAVKNKTTAPLFADLKSYQMEETQLWHNLMGHTADASNMTQSEWNQLMSYLGQYKTLKLGPGTKVYQGLRHYHPETYDNLTGILGNELGDVQAQYKTWQQLYGPGAILNPQTNQTPGPGSGSGVGAMSGLITANTNPIVLNPLPGMKNAPIEGYASGGVALGDLLGSLNMLPASPTRITGGVQPTVGAVNRATREPAHTRSAAAQATASGQGTNVTFGDINITNPRPEAASTSLTHATQRATFLAGRQLG